MCLPPVFNHLKLPKQSFSINLGDITRCCPVSPYLADFILFGYLRIPMSPHDFPSSLAGCELSFGQVQAVYKRMALKASNCSRVACNLLP